MSEGLVLMSGKEADRLGVVRDAAEGRVRQRQAAERLGLGVRQVKRLVRRYRERGAAGLTSGRRGRRSNNAIAAEVRGRAMDLVRERYADFGPTFAREKLVEVHGFRLSAETLRKWMLEDGLRRAKPRRGAPVRQRRPRRPCFGELVQVDGSEHAWFEDRGPRCSLIVFIDDATSRLLALRFVPAETTEAYMEVLRGHLDGHGRPVAVYSDKHGVFRVNHREREGELTQFGRALRTLDIEPIHAGSPQAKGRVERANGTLQDRLVKEMRLRGIDGMEAGNAFLPEFMEDHNRRFAVEPLCPADAHRPVLHDAAELGLILSLHSTRKVSRSLTLRYRGREHQIQVRGQGYGLRGARVTVCEGFDGRVAILRDGRPLAFRVLAEGEPPVSVEDEKSVRHAVDRAKARQQARPNWKPAPDHPWRRAARVGAERAAAGP